MIGDRIAFIRQVNNIHQALEDLSSRAKEESSQFQWSIDNARLSIESVKKTYDEVLNRDINEDEAYIPALKGVE